MLVNLAPGLFGIISLPLKNYLFLCRQKPGSKQEGTNFSIIHLLLSAILSNDAYSIIINITLILFFRHTNPTYYDCDQCDNRYRSRKGK